MSNDKYDYGFSFYTQARMECALGANESAISSLANAFDHGYTFSIERYEYDPGLSQLFDEPEFIKLLDPLDLNGFDSGN